jgi:hypothetical protein
MGWAPNAQGSTAVQLTLLAAHSLSGEEVLLFSSLSPALLSICRIRSFVLEHAFLLQLTTFGGNAAYKIDDEGAVRLRVVAFAVGAGCLHHSARWWEVKVQPGELTSRVG